MGTFICILFERHCRDLRQHLVDFAFSSTPDPDQRSSESTRSIQDALLCLLQLTLMTSIFVPSATLCSFFPNGGFCLELRVHSPFSEP
jgi:hypothetical protein